MIGRVIRGKYKILDEVGRGGLATVYLARNLITGETVAVKVLHPQLVASSGENFLKRFEREAEILIHLQDDHIPAVFDYGEEDGINFIVMEYIQGVAVSTLIRQRGQLAVEVALEICRQTLRALQVAHENRIVHRDIKPANLMVTVGNVVKVMDFGIAKNLEAQGLTQTGMLGTPNYISPEQADGRGTDTRSDIYSLGAALFEMLTGKLLFDGDSAITVAIKHISAPVPPIRALRPDIPPAVEAIVYRALEKDPAARFQTPAEMAEAIDQILGDYQPTLIDSSPLYVGAEPGRSTYGGQTRAGRTSPGMTPSRPMTPVSGRTGPITRLGTTGAGTTAVPVKRAGPSPLLFAGAGAAALVLLLLVAGAAAFFVLRGSGAAPAIEAAVLASGLNPDQSPAAPVSTYGPNDPFFLSVRVKDATPNTRVKAVWYAGKDKIEGGESTATFTKAGSDYAGFKLQPKQPWAPGDYRAEVYLNDELKKTLTFSVGGGPPGPGPTSTLPTNATVEELIAEGDRLTLSSKFDDANALYKQANQQDPKNATVLARWGRALAYQQNFRDATDKLEEATKVDPRNAEALGYLSLVYDWTFRFDDAFDTVNKALAIDPNSADLHAFKAEIILDRNDDVSGAEREAQFAQSLGQNKASVQRVLSNIAYRKSRGTDPTQLKIAEDAMKKAIELEPNVYLRHYELGVLYINTNRPDDALAAFNKANELYSKSAPVHFGLGKAYQLKRDCTNASREFRIALGFDPNYQSAKEGLAACS